MTNAPLPAGWTLPRIRDVSGDQEAVTLSAERVVRRVSHTGTHERLHPEIVLGFHSLCLVKPLHDDCWYMGSLNEDGSADCWTRYDDLHEALRGL